MRFIIQTALSLIGSCCLIYSTFSKKKDNMLLWQTTDCGFNAVATLIAGSFTGTTTCILCGIRNFLNAKHKLTKWLTILFCILLFVLGILVNKIGWIGYLPPIAAVEYTIWSALAKNAQQLRAGLIINCSIWAIHDCYVHLYPSTITYIIIIILSIVNLIINRNKQEQ